MPEFGGPYYASAGTTVTRYHQDPDCPRLSQSSRSCERSASYVDWHELDPCAYCYDEVETPSPSSGYQTAETILGGEGDG